MIKKYLYNKNQLLLVKTIILKNAINKSKSNKSFNNIKENSSSFFYYI